MDVSILFYSRVPDVLWHIFGLAQGRGEVRLEETHYYVRSGASVTDWLTEWVTTDCNLRAHSQSAVGARILCCRGSNVYVLQWHANRCVFFCDFGLSPLTCKRAQKLETTLHLFVSEQRGDKTISTVIYIIWIITRPRIHSTFTFHTVFVSVWVLSEAACWPHLSIKGHSEIGPEQPAARLDHLHDLIVRSVQSFVQSA